MVKLNIQLPQDFLNEETRCGFLVNETMKELWAVLLDLLMEFNRVCSKYNIQYIASGGTMLGAIRHHGFIPWDDDLDLMMPREDYNRLCEIAPKAFSNPYFFQTEYTDHGFMRGFARLRNSDTAGIQKFEFNKHFTFNQGIFIDIFPMDEVVSDEYKLKAQSRRSKRLFSLACIMSEMTDRFPPNRKPHWKFFYKVLGHYLFGRIINSFRLQDWFLAKFDKECSKYNGTGQPTWSLLSFQFNNRKHDLPKYELDDVVYVDFEFMKIPVPKQYDVHLKNKYGDYMNPKQIPNYHGDVYFDTKQSYKVILGLS